MNGAPAMTATANSLIVFLDAVLVNGFGSQTVTSIVVTNNVATVRVDTGYVVSKYAVVNISGATPSGLNGDKKVLSATANNILFTYDATGIADQTATGTITVKFPGAGWTKPFANTTANVAVYRNDSANGTGTYVRVADSTTTTARVIGYETMTDENTGTNLCPTTSQLSGGIYFTKANNTSARKWWVVADSKTFYFACATMTTVPDNIKFFIGFGDFKKYNENDNYNFFIVGDVGDRSGFGGITTPYSNVLSTTTGSKYVMRNYAQTPGAKTFDQFFLFSDLPNSISGAAVNTPLAYPQVPKNTVHLSPTYIVESSSIRGEYPGLYSSAQNLRPINYDFVDDDVLLKDGKYYIYKGLEVGADAGTYGREGAGFIDIVGPWV